MQGILLAWEARGGSHDDFKSDILIALVSVFMPHEPDLDSRPGAHFTLPAPIASLIGVNDVSLGDMSSLCKDRESACASGVNMADNFQSVMVAKLDQVREQIERSRRERE